MGTVYMKKLLINLTYLSSQLSLPVTLLGAQSEAVHIMHLR